MKGIITEIQRFSLNDGPGIRTTVFLKGCNMKCSWCHNPETIAREKELHYYDKNCIGCCKCGEVCPTGAQKAVGGVHSYEKELCIGCGRCADICYAEAMVVSGTAMTVEEIMEEVIQDKAYYADSGGGLTLSGGETLCQMPFADELTEACHREGIPVALETNLSFNWEDIEPFMKKMDYIMCDLKIFNEAEHIRWTGMSNSKVKKNIKSLSALGIPFVVRTPLIPGATDSRENIRSIAVFLSQIEGLRYYELLNYNPLGEAKYRSLGRENPFQEARPLSADRLAPLKEAAEGCGIIVRTE